MDKKKLILKISLIAGVLLLLIGTVLFFTREGSSGTGGDNDTNIAVFIPIWAAIIPTLVAQRKRKDEEIPSGQRKLILLLVGLTLLAVVGTLFYVLLNV